LEKVNFVAFFCGELKVRNAASQGEVRRLEAFYQQLEREMTRFASDQ
jgi:hypothetical protein